MYDIMDKVLYYSSLASSNSIDNCDEYDDNDGNDDNDGINC